MRKIRVAQIVPSLARAGSERMVAYLAAGLDRNRFDASIVALYDEADAGVEDVPLRSGVPVFHLGKKPGPDARTFFRLRTVLDQIQPDILHTHLYVLCYLFPLLGRYSSALCFHTVHNVAEREVEMAGRLLQRILFRRRVAPIAIADTVASTIRRTYGIDPAAVIPNGIPVAEYTPNRLDRAAWRRAEGYSDADVLYVSVARLSRQKNPGMLVEAFAAGPAKAPGTRLLLIGDGELRQQLEQQVERIGLSDRIRFAGTRSDVSRILRSADVFVLASSWEGNPLCVLEAMAAGLPVAGTRVGGVPELVEEGRHGYLIAPGDHAALAGAMLHLLDSPALRTGMGRASRARALERFDVSVMNAAYERLYTEALGAKSDQQAAVAVGSP